MALEKAQLGGVRVLFNPSQYNLETGNQFAEIGVPGLGAPVIQFVRGNARTLSMDLFLDAYETGGDIEAATRAIYDQLAIDPQTHAPPVTEFEWGRLSFRCVVERVSGRYTLFRESGVPVRATLTVTLKEYVDLEQYAMALNPQSADHVKTYVTARGDTLPSIAAAQYGDPAAWRPIADANGIANPSRLEPGRTLVIPALPGGTPAGAKR